MATLSIMTMGKLNEAPKPVYSLFQKGGRLKNTPETVPDSETKPRSTSLSSTLPETQLLSNPTEQPKISSKTPSSRGQTQLLAIDPSSNGELASSLEVDLNGGRRKRVKTASPEDGATSANKDTLVGQTKVTTDVARRQRQPRNSPKATTSVSHVASTKLLMNGADGDDKGNAATVASNKSQSKHKLKDSPVIVIEDSTDSNPEVEQNSKPSSSVFRIEVPLSNAEKQGQTQTKKPVKLLKFNPKTGTIGSPPGKKSDLPNGTTSKKKGSQLKPLVIKYGLSLPLPASLGQKIDDILDGSRRTGKPPTEKAANFVGPPGKPTQTLKSLHPLFLGKTVKKPPAIIDISGNDELTTPNTNNTRSLTTSKPLSRPLSTAFSGFGSSTKILKFPGAVTPSWPWQGMVHIRGHEELNYNRALTVSQSRKGQKGKYTSVEVSPADDIINLFAENLNIGTILKDIDEINPDEFPLPPACLRLPIKHHETGTNMQRRIRKEIHAVLSDSKSSESSEDEIQGAGRKTTRIHPALTKMYSSIATSIPAFDQGQCETQSWTQKHSPECAAEVLQTGPEASILKEWLQNLTVQSVEGGSGRLRASSLKAENAGKRKRKPKKLDSFIVSSDYESDDLDEISEPEDATSSLAHGRLRTEVSGKGFKDSRKLNNVVLISGPHGCGKTATVYAVAKEMGFEVFEINSSSRRSGKDILEKVGDMTRNHLVHHHPSSKPTDSEQNDIDAVDEALASDIQSGRQGTMISFFKPKQTAKPKSKPKNPTKSIKKLPSKEELKPKAPPKQQKQSLILIEEVDIIYEEDKQFWATVMNLIEQSKRPIIMTCNNELVVPSLRYHAKLRLSPPPTNLAVDYLLLTAASEGHALRRDAVKALYESRSFDLRASLAELDFWCQFAVGDQKCGLDWMYRRRPNKGNDKNFIRVVSEGTYQTGMGWLSQDFIESHIHHLEVEEETLHEAWDGWGLDVGDWQSQLRINDWASHIDNQASKPGEKLAALKIYSDFAEAMSNTDLCSGRTYASDHMINLDLSLPALTTKVRDDYVLAHPLLEASPTVEYNRLSKDMSIWMKSRTRNLFQLDQHIKHDFEVPPQLSPPSEKDILRSIRKQATAASELLERPDLSLAFDSISIPELSSCSTSGKFEASCFDRSKALIVEDLAPYVRSIVSYDVRLQEERLRLSNILSEGGRKNKRTRTTRAAMSALEGGARSTTRKERYFGAALNPQLVLRTGKQSWLDALILEMASTAGSRSESRRSSYDTGRAQFEDED